MATTQYVLQKQHCQSSKYTASGIMYLPFMSHIQTCYFYFKKKLAGVNHSGAINKNSIYLNTIKNSPKLMWSYKNNKIHFSDFLKVSMS